MDLKLKIKEIEAEIATVEATITKHELGIADAKDDLHDLKLIHKKFKQLLEKAEKVDPTPITKSLRS